MRAGCQGWVLSRVGAHWCRSNCKVAARVPSLGKVLLVGCWWGTPHEINISVWLRSLGGESNLGGLRM